MILAQFSLTALYSKHSRFLPRHYAYTWELPVMVFPFTPITCIPFFPPLLPLYFVYFPRYTSLTSKTNAHCQQSSVQQPQITTQPPPSQPQSYSPATESNTTQKELQWQRPYTGPKGTTAPAETTGERVDVSQSGPDQTQVSTTPPPHSALSASPLPASQADASP